jgi:hypothetical protein
MRTAARRRRGTVDRPCRCSGHDAQAHGLENINESFCCSRRGKWQLQFPRGERAPARVRVTCGWDLTGRGSTLHLIISTLHLTNKVMKGFARLTCARLDAKAAPPWRGRLAASKSSNHEGTTIGIEFLPAHVFYPPSPQASRPMALAPVLPPVGARAGGRHPRFSYGRLARYSCT